MWRVHVRVVTRLADALVPPMAQRGCGRVVVQGAASRMACPARAYAATKAARGARAKLGERGRSEGRHDPTSSRR